MPKTINTQNWEISLIQLKNGGIKYKVTRKNLENFVSETLVFKNKLEAILKFDEWTNQ